MHHRFIWNTASFAGASDDSILSQLAEAFEGILQIPAAGEIASLYFEGDKKLLQRQISEGYVLSDFIDHLVNTGRQEFAMIILDLDDKADAISSLPDDVVSEMASTSYYFSHLAYEGSSDTLALLAALDGILFSVGTIDPWCEYAIQFSTYPPPDPYSASIAYSVCDKRTSTLVSQALAPPSATLTLDQLLPNCQFTEAFQSWIQSITEENFSMLKKKLLLAHERAFMGGKPLFDTLNDADGMREVRMSAHGGGAIRVLFGAIPGGRQALLRGFIKKSDNEGYVENISAGIKDWKKLK